MVAAGSYSTGDPLHCHEHSHMESGSMDAIQNLYKVMIFIALVLMMISCTKHPTNPNDPYERYNRAMFGFNMGMDHAIYRPIAKVYTTVTPTVLQKGVTNVFANVGELTTIPNDVLQCKFKYALMDIWRFLINTTLGVGGLFDIATRMGLPKHYEDFSLTLAYYSDNPQSPYLILPFLGPLTVRDAVTQYIDYWTAPWPYLSPDSLTYSMFALKWVNIRSRLLPADKLIDIAFDPYAFVRSAYLQTRDNLIKNNKHDYQPGDQPYTPYTSEWVAVSGHADVVPLNKIPTPTEPTSK